MGLLVLRRSHGDDDLWIMDLEGYFVAQVTDEPSTYGWCSWAPASGF